MNDLTVLWPGRMGIVQAPEDCRLSAWDGHIWNIDMGWRWRGIPARMYDLLMVCAVCPGFVLMYCCSCTCRGADVPEGPLPYRQKMWRKDKVAAQLDPMPIENRQADLDSNANMALTQI